MIPYGELCAIFGRTRKSSTVQINMRTKLRNVIHIILFTFDMNNTYICIISYYELVNTWTRIMRHLFGVSLFKFMIVLESFMRALFDND